MVYWPRLRLPPGLTPAFWTALILVLGVELALHSEEIIHRYRAVFALGRAYDKLRYVEHNSPAILLIGNSRIDNGVDPRTMGRAAGVDPSGGFNLGLPGANALVYHGLIKRLDALGLLGGMGVTTVVLGLDESALHEDDSLGYVGFLADRSTLLEVERYRDWLGSIFRVWSYSGNLRQLREPDKLLRFIEATVRSRDPIGGAAATHLGYRAGFGATQNVDQIVRQESAASEPPVPEVEAFLWRAIDLMKTRGVRVVVTIPPLRDRTSAFFDPSPAAAPYRAVLTRLHHQRVTVLPASVGYSPSDFINAGHLNNRGAQRYSAELGRQLAELGVR